MLHNNGSTINNKLADMVCGQSSIVNCKAQAHPDISKLDDFYIDIWNSTDKNQLTSRFYVKPDTFLYLDVNGDLVS